MPPEREKRERDRRNYHRYKKGHRRGGIERRNGTYSREKNQDTK